MVIKKDVFTRRSQHVRTNINKYINTLKRCDFCAISLLVLSKHVKLEDSLFIDIIIQIIIQ